MANSEIEKLSPRLKARIAGVFYLLCLLMGIFANFFARGRLGFVAELIAVACYIAMTLLLYGLFKPVNRSLSLLAAFLNFVGLTLGKLDLHPPGVNIELVFVGFYDLLIGYLIFRSTFLPRILGVLMAFAGFGWLTFLSSPLANYLSPYNLVPGFLGAISLTLWLLVMGVNAQRWKEQAGMAGAFIRA